MPDARITDLNHLITVGTRIQRHVEILTRRWINEEHAAYTPPTNGNTTRTGGPSDPTGTCANHHRDHRTRNRIGDQLLAADRTLTAIITETTPVTPDRPCDCCHTDTATHGRDRHGRPVLCHPCQRYLRTHRHRCNQAVHDDRPRIRWCECPPDCCDPCPDHAADGRRLSDRCRQRKARGVWGAA